MSKKAESIRKSKTDENALLKTAHFIRRIVPKPVYNLIRVLYMSPAVIKGKIRLSQVKRRHIRDNTIVVIGDSHSLAFLGNGRLVFDWEYITYNEHMSLPEGNEKAFSVFHIPAPLAYNAGKYGTHSRFTECVDYLKKCVLIKGDLIIFALGTIDLRTHVFKHVDETHSWKDVVNGIIFRYCVFLLEMKRGGVSDCMLWTYCYGNG